MKSGVPEVDGRWGRSRRWKRAITRFRPWIQVAVDAMRCAQRSCQFRQSMHFIFNFSPPDLCFSPNTRFLFPYGFPHCALHYASRVVKLLPSHATMTIHARGRIILLLFSSPARKYPNSWTCLHHQAV
jgi:hypothetical protein